MSIWPEKPRVKPSLVTYLYSEPQSPDPMQTSRLHLTRLNKDHAPGYFAIWSDPFTTRWSSHGPCETLLAATEWMSSLLPESNPKGENYGVFLRPDLDPTTIEEFRRQNASVAGSSDVLDYGQLLGWVGTWRSEPAHEVGFIFHRATWGLGFATEALRGFVELFWTERPEVNVLKAYCDTENEGSIRVLRKAGFECVETTYGDYVLPWMEPSTRDTMEFEVLRPGSVKEIN
ncbi:GNAT domain-containing protein [Aspergillus granulosus]|uniref:GNAT domain-containing protein n=1 Tax=Aspergillus granulosus TaxID=176169 RepID=A0ABR4GVM6_9EURO